MDKKTKEILEELYAIDQSFRGYEKDLVEIIQKLLLSKPDTKVNAEFIKKLKLKVSEKPKTSSMLFFKWALAGVFALALIIFFAYPKQQQDQQFAVEEKIEKLGENAFGRIYFSQQDQQKSLSVEGSNRDFMVGEDKVIVYRKAKGSSIGNSLNNLLGGIRTDLLDAGKFSDRKIGSLEFSEDRDFGYSVYFDARNDSVYINPNWEKWPNYGGVTPLSKSVDSSIARPEGNPLDPIPDSHAISIADSFVSQYGLDMSDYEKGEVLRLWYGGEDVAVVYPLKVSGQIAYEENGQKYGLYVNVSSRYEKVTSAGNISPNLFESSEYAPELDAGKAIEIAERGGIYGYIPLMESSVRTVDIELGTPEKKLVKIWVYSDKFNSGEIFAPALVFPFLNKPEGFYRDNIVVPLVGLSNEEPVRVMK